MASSPTTVTGLLAPPSDALVFYADEVVQAQRDRSQAFSDWVLVLLLPLFGLLRLLRLRRERLPRGAAVLWLTDEEIGGYDVTGTKRAVVVARRAGAAFTVQYGDRIGFRDGEGRFRIIDLDLLSDAKRLEALSTLGLAPWRPPV